MGVSITDTNLYVLNMTRRMTFHFGNVHVAEGPQILLELTADVDGVRETGLSMGALAPMWFHKNPDMGMEEGVADMVTVFEAACDHAESADAEPTVFDAWWSLYDAVGDWAADTPHPPLLWSYGVSLVEQALIDAFCRATDTAFPDAVHENTLGIDLGRIYDDLDGVEPTDLLPDSPTRSIAVRHTVGLSDPLVPADVEPADRLDDGLPQTLSEYVEQQGVAHFKIKLAADEGDADRLRRIHTLLSDSSLSHYAFTLDANEQYGSVGEFREQWETMQADANLDSFLDNLLYVEQPLSRDEAFSDETRRVFAEWADHPPVIIDESDDHVTSLATALDCGYAGTSHKNCKGVFKGIANRCLIEHRRRTDGNREYLMSGEDLTTLGPVELQEDLAVMATLGMDHVERNGHHYYRGLSMLPTEVQDNVLDAHDDLYRRHEDGFPTLDIRDGRIRIDSVLAAPFGHDVDLSATRFTPIENWRVESIYQ
ncbi:hypothetical protein ACFQH3_18225 [Haladaptatus sp. GCM10025707]|uniref:hypothetical protein n=1 Tax=unclassified Haladaptatus TaxID=2622732 RepID=UPI0023E8129B|nr:hypothetical protein [Haladaptatus sp. QDMS2]